jgi:hypothetical protein
MTVWQGSAAIPREFAAYHAEQNLKVFGANGLGADQTAVDRVTMVGRAIGGDICFFNEISALGHFCLRNYLWSCIPCYKHLIVFSRDLVAMIGKNTKHPFAVRHPGDTHESL